MTDGSKYIPYEERTGPESVVYFTRDISPAGIKKVFERVNENITGKGSLRSRNYILCSFKYAFCK